MPYRLLSLLLIGTSCFVGLTGCGQVPPNPGDAEIQYIRPDAETGTSAAVVVPAVPLAITTNFLPYDAQGQLVGRGDVDAQIEQVLQNVRAALGAVDAEPTDIVKANVYTRTDEAADRVREHFGRTFSGRAKPAITFAVGKLRHPDVDVALDVVAVAEGADPAAHVEVADVYGEPRRAHVAVLPPGGHVYVSGQVARGESIIDATRETFEASLARLSYMGLPASSIEQVKVFVDEIEQADTIETVLAEYFLDKPSPPIVSLEWVHEGFDIEIEMIASTTQPSPDQSITFTTPPGLTAVPVYSRVATIHDGRVVYVSGLYGDSTLTGEEQIRDIFGQFEAILSEAGTDFDHLAKGQYYVVDWDVVRPLGTVRGEYYQPETPPTSSLIPVRGVGAPGSLISIDVIGVVPANP